MKLSNKTKPKIDRRRYSRGSAGYNFDNGDVAFDRPGKRYKKGEKEEEQP